jgi:hypothetical protein
MVAGARLPSITMDGGHKVKLASFGLWTLSPPEALWGIERVDHFWLVSLGALFSPHGHLEAHEASCFSINFRSFLYFPVTILRNNYLINYLLLEKLLENILIMSLN